MFRPIQLSRLQYVAVMVIWGYMGRSALEGIPYIMHNACNKCYLYSVLEEGGHIAQCIRVNFCATWKCSAPLSSAVLEGRGGLYGAEYGSISGRTLLPSHAAA